MQIIKIFCQFFLDVGKPNNKLLCIVIIYRYNVHHKHFIKPQFQTQNQHWTNKSTRILKNGLPQGSTLSPILFNIYISDIPTTVSHQYGYADDMALLYSHKCWSKVEEALSRDTEDLADFLQTWRLKLNSSKTTSTPFHLNNHDAQRQLNICVHGTTLPHDSRTNTPGQIPTGQIPTGHIPTGQLPPLQNTPWTYTHHKMKCEEKP